MIISSWFYTYYYSGRSFMKRYIISITLLLMSASIQSADEKPRAELELAFSIDDCQRVDSYIKSYEQEKTRGNLQHIVNAYTKCNSLEKYLKIKFRGNDLNHWVNPLDRESVDRTLSKVKHNTFLAHECYTHGKCSGVLSHDPISDLLALAPTKFEPECDGTVELKKVTIR